MSAVQQMDLLEALARREAGQDLAIAHADTETTRCDLDSFIRSSTRARRGWSDMETSWVATSECGRDHCTGSRNRGSLEASQRGEPCMPALRAQVRAEVFPSEISAPLV